MSTGNIVALVSIVISIIFALVTSQATNALWLALHYLCGFVVVGTSSLGGVKPLPVGSGSPYTSSTRRRIPGCVAA
jgi:hypothetical protein